MTILDMVSVVYMVYATKALRGNFRGKLKLRRKSISLETSYEIYEEVCLKCIFPIGKYTNPACYGSVPSEIFLVIS